MHHVALISLARVLISESEWRATAAMGPHTGTDTQELRRKTTQRWEAA